MGSSIGLIQVDGKWPNLALMKISAWHKSQGDAVETFAPLFDSPDKIYASKVFCDSPGYPAYPSTEVVRGGSGYSLTTELPPEIEQCRPDYAVFGCEYAMGFTTRGCIRRCEFCIVPEKEGSIRAVADLGDFWDGQPLVKLLDNNLTALPRHLIEICRQIAQEGVEVTFTQGLDIRLVTNDIARAIKSVRLWKRTVYFAWDKPEIESSVRKGITTLNIAGVKPYSLTFYVLIGFDTTPEQDLHRVMVLKGLGANPFVMPYNKKDAYQRRFARWVNHKAVFKSVPWEDYTG